MMVPSAPFGWVPTMVAEPEGPLRMLAPSDCTRAPMPHVAGAGADVTVIAAVPLWPPLVAVMVAEPATSPDTSPLAFTDAMDALLDDQVIVCALSAFPAESRGVAVSRNVSPATIEPELGDTTTD